MTTQNEYPKKSDLTSLYGYRVDLILGEGGTGTVYRGLSPDTGEVVALKLFHANFFRNAMHLRDMVKTAKKCKKLDHPNVVKVMDFIQGDEGSVLVLEYIDGPDLKWYIENRPFNLKERLVITAQICNGLGYLHEEKIQHHDMKPANVLFTRKGQVKLCDFSLYGSSILAMFDSGMQGQITPMYVAPEIIKKEKSGFHSDMYSFGVMLYLMFTEHVPFEVDNLQKLYLSHVHTEAIHPTTINPACPQALGDIIMRLMEKDPAKRYPDCQQLRIALSEIGRSRI